MATYPIPVVRNVAKFYCEIEMQKKYHNPVCVYTLST